MGFLHSLLTGESGTKDPHRKFYPNEEAYCQHNDANGQPVWAFLYGSQYEFTHKSCTEQQTTGNNKVEECPIHFIAELHGYQGYEQ